MKKIVSFIISRDRYMTNPFLAYVMIPESIKYRIAFVSEYHVDKYLRAIESDDDVVEALFANMDSGYVQTLQHEHDKFTVTIYESDNTECNKSDTP